jgi:cytoskeletal protein CcmA (bactofilin family)
MFGAKKAATEPIGSLIGVGTVIEGNVRFRGGLRIDGEVRGSVMAEEGVPSMLVLSEQARVEGAVRASHLVVNGSIQGPVEAEELVELQPKARVVGDLRYRAMEMHHGAVIDGTLSHLESERPSLKLASSQD